MVAALTSPSISPEKPQALPVTGQGHPSFFHRLLSELNPLQYVPVVGTIYRAVTGDVISQEARFAGSLVFSGLTSGPLGLAINLGTTALERVTGIDPETIGTRLLADIGVGGHAPATQAVANAAGSAPARAVPNPDTNTAKPWSAAQLSAYGVRQGAGGILARGAESGADVLNSLELTRLSA
jgi:hypothetical protein